MIDGCVGLGQVDDVGEEGAGVEHGDGGAGDGLDLRHDLTDRPGDRVWSGTPGSVSVVTEPHRPTRQPGCDASSG